jgi:hypothetical protein
MSIVLPTLFIMAGLISVAAIWHAVSSNLNAIMDLRRRVAMAEFGSEIIVTLRDDAQALDPVAAVRRSRQLRHPLPKPITHRLHQFAKARSAA